MSDAAPSIDRSGEAGDTSERHATAPRHQPAPLHPTVRAWLGDGAPKSSSAVEHLLASAETLARSMAHREALGITRVADITGLDTVAIPVVTAHRPNARSLSVAQGKGANLDDATASAVMEAVETAHAERPEVALRLASAAELRAAGERHVDPAALARHGPIRVGTCASILWARGVSLVDGAAVDVPYDAVHLDLTTDIPTTGSLVLSSNGLASGSTRAEAVVHGLCELIERDACRLWELAEPDHRSATRVDPATVTDPVCEDLLARVEHADLDVAIHDLTSDLGIPVVLVQLADRRPNPFRPLAPAAGVGCHLHPATALRRAITEAAQTRLIDIAGLRDDLDPATYAAAAERSGRTDAEVPVLEPLPQGARSHGADGGLATSTMAGDVAVLVRALRDAGLEPVVVDLTSERFGIAVVRCVVAGLEGLPVMMAGVAATTGDRARAVLARAGHRSWEGSA
ncbi:MAG: YcaO-like family protein [Actinomycetota bacterium]|nr:YcaO-like family protein [Actinomycetota bacterium]